MIRPIRAGEKPEVTKTQLYWYESMLRIDDRLVYSATDLVGFLECGHLANLERAAVSGHLDRPMRVDPVLDRIA